MSGGHFDYAQYHINDIAQEIEELITTNDTSLDECGLRIGRGYSRHTIRKFKEAVMLLKKAQIAVQRIDWLVSGDDSDEDFHKRWAHEMFELENNKEAT
jgi:hypothetical protein